MIHGGNKKGVCECARRLAPREQPGITDGDQSPCSACKAIGKEGTGGEDHWVGGPVVCGKLVEDAPVRVSDNKNHLRRKKLSSPFA